MGYLREATKQDLELLFEWANESAVRENSFSSKIITHQEHSEWFENLLLRNDVKQYIYLKDDEPVGQIRVTIKGTEAEIGYSISAQKRGLGCGKEMVCLLREKIKQEFPAVERLVAKVKPDNFASQKIFLDNGYKEKYYFYELEVDEKVNG